MDLKARVNVNCKRKDGRMNGWPDKTEYRTPMSHTAKAGATKSMHSQANEQLFPNRGSVSYPK